MPFRRSPDAVSTPVDDGATVVLHLSTQTYFTLNATGEVLWEYLDDHETATKRDLVAALLDHVTTDVDPAQVEADVQAFLTSMRDADLIVADT